MYWYALNIIDGPIRSYDSGRCFSFSVLPPPPSYHDYLPASRLSCVGFEDSRRISSRNTAVVGLERRRAHSDAFRIEQYSSRLVGRRAPADLCFVKYAFVPNKIQHYIPDTRSLQRIILTVVIIIILLWPDPAGRVRESDRECCNFFFIFRSRENSFFFRCFSFVNTATCKPWPWSARLDISWSRLTRPWTAVAAEHRTRQPRPWSMMKQVGINKILRYYGTVFRVDHVGETLVHV